MDKKDLAERQVRIAEKFKIERVRLGMTRRTVAALCAVTETTVVNWEHGGMKIPLLVLELLMPHGFSAESLVEFPESLVHVRRIGVDGRASGWTLVNVYALRRWLAEKEDVFVFHEPAAEGIQGYVSGKAGLFRKLIDDLEIVKDASGLFLLKRRRASRVFLCEIAPGVKGGVTVRTGRLRKSVSAERLFQECQPLGVYLGPVDEIAEAVEGGDTKPSLHETELRKALG